MNYRPRLYFLSAVVLFLSCLTPLALAGSSQEVTAPSPDAGSRYGLFGLLDRRSQYGQGFFPEPFLVDDIEGESGELRLDWLHTTTRGAYDDSFRAEIEQGFGLLTLEIAGSYQRAIAVPDRTEGFGSIELAVRHPVYQYVSPSGAIDSTFGVGFEVALPTDSHVGKHTEFVPKVFNALRLGSRFSAQMSLGISVLSGGGGEGGRQTLEYGVTLGYSILHHDLALPGIERIIPVFEVSGEKQLNQEGAGEDRVLGNIAVRFNLNSIGPIQPRLGVGYVFPLNSAAREDVHSGIFTSLVFDF